MIWSQPHQLGEPAYYFTDGTYFIHWSSRNPGLSSVVSSRIPGCFAPGFFLLFTWFLTHCLLLSTRVNVFLGFWPSASELFLVQPMPDHSSPRLSFPSCLCSPPHAKLCHHLYTRSQHEVYASGISSAHAEWLGDNRKQGGRKEPWRPQGHRWSIFPLF